jgi:hypothetical protein
VSQSFEFTCASCGEVHRGSPSFSYKAPVYYSGALTAKDEVSLGTDLCVIADQDYFIRTILEIPIHEHSAPFTWGVWVSLKKENFEAYRDGNREGSYFGWLSSKLPYYADTVQLKTMAKLRPGGFRPCLQLDNSDHELCRDYRDGISWEKAVKIATIAMHEYEASAQLPKKAWWRLW